MAQSKDDFRLLTLNTHSWQESDNVSSLNNVAEAILIEQPDVIALQEVNQSQDGTLADPDRLVKSGFVSCGFDIVENNWALLLVEKLQSVDEVWHWSWGFAHLGYPGWAEGVALLSRTPLSQVRSTIISNPDLTSDNWNHRRVLAGRNESGWFCSVHSGWWGDEVDPFCKQWERLSDFAQSLDGPRYLMGDFNCPAHLPNEGYAMILDSDFEDCYARAIEKDNGITVPGKIDGWSNVRNDGLRLDFCFAGQPGHTLRSRVIFNGEFYPIVSDHFGVFTWEEKTKYSDNKTK